MNHLIPAAILLLSLSPAAVHAETGVTIGPLAQSFFPDDDDDRPELFLPEEGDSDASNFRPREGDSDPSNFLPREGDSDPSNFEPSFRDSDADNFESPDLDELSQPTRPTRALA